MQTRQARAKHNCYKTKRTLCPQPQNWTGKSDKIVGGRLLDPLREKPPAHLPTDSPAFLSWVSTRQCPCQVLRCHQRWSGLRATEPTRLRDGHQHVRWHTTIFLNEKQSHADMVFDSQAWVHLSLKQMSPNVSLHSFVHIILAASPPVEDRPSSATASQQQVRGAESDQ